MRRRGSRCRCGLRSRLYRCSHLLHPACGHFLAGSLGHSKSPRLAGTLDLRSPQVFQNVDFIRSDPLRFKKVNDLMCLSFSVSRIKQDERQTYKGRLLQDIIYFKSHKKCQSVGNNWGLKNSKLQKIIFGVPQIFPYFI